MQHKMLNAPAAIEAIFFDLDNTLIDRDRAFRSMLPEWLAKRAVAVDPAHYEMHIHDICRYDDSGFTDRREFADWLCKKYSIKHLTVNDVVEEMATSTAAYVTKRKHVIGMLTILKEHYALGVITNGGSRSQRSKLERAGLTTIFDDNKIYIEGERYIAKPDPGFFQLAIKDQGISPGRILFVGDHPINDMQGASAVGMKTWWISNGRTLSDYAIKPDGMSETAEDFFQQISCAYV